MTMCTANQRKLLEFIYLYASGTTSPQPLPVSRISELLDWPSSTIRDEADMLSAASLVEFHCDKEYLIITRSGVEHLIRSGAIYS